ncbi:DUF4345 domain-containing protein [Leptospira langatensis]|uniref:DUF4345 domain-containing protein n=1 Tax=Leptospira langatensis TaxID=2484983 RepID=A0A5F1ZX11_9LEPT|nr:DUF4345 family protein [Leptospira langatensis]TGK01435.1 DUF4345 domain-containing protein [Leptospira langatensis]TGL42115.1 DUF4345 domain-containing protein [Leptospira langatensis]
MQTHTISTTGRSETSPWIGLITKVFLGMNLAVYLAFTIAFFLFPVPLAGMIGLSVHSSAALADLRAMYGGMCFGVGLLIFYGLNKEDFKIPAILLSVASAGGLFLARLYTLLLDGPGNEYIYLSMITEIGSVCIGLWLLKKR